MDDLKPEMGEHIYWVLKMGAYMGRLHTKRFKVYKRVRRDFKGGKEICYFSI